MILQGEFSRITDVNQFLKECTDILNKVSSDLRCESARSGSIVVSISALSEQNIQLALDFIEDNNGIETPTFGRFSSGNFNS